MNNSRFGFIVGVFVFVGVALLALLILSFSSGVTLFQRTYKLHLILPNAAGLKPAAEVMMAGVPIGKVSEMGLTNDNKSVNITVSILNKFNNIPTNAVFVIDALGFLGDEYIKVSMPVLKPGQTNDAPFFTDGNIVEGKATLDLQEQIQSVSDLLDQAKSTLRDADEAITNVNRTVLSADTLGKVEMAVSNLQVVSGTAVTVITRAEGLMDANVAPINNAISNFVELSASLTNTAAELNQIVVTNQDDVRKVVTKLASASERIDLLVSNLQSGQGTAGRLLKDEKMSAQMASLISNASAISANISIFSSNLNQKGIWAMLWKPKHVGTNRPPAWPTKP